VEGTSLRDIAHDAGLTAGLVRHHFGSKEGLREACDAYALERLMSIKETAVGGGELGSSRFLSEVQPELLVLHRYLARSIVDGSPAAQVVLERMIALSEQWIGAHHAGEFADEKAVACVLAAAQIGILMVREQISQVFGADVDRPGGQLRLDHALIEFYSVPLLSPDLAARAHAALGDRASASPRPVNDPDRALPTHEPTRPDKRTARPDGVRRDVYR
jgi:TetR/AcrR family transcriptional regulator, regulator of cefoperazone and chloramphenicol sensitivity